MVRFSSESLDPEFSQVALLHRISNIVSSELSIDEMLGEIIGLTVQVTGCDACLVYLVDPATHELVLRGSQVPHAADLGRLRIKVGEGVSGWVAQHRSAVALTANAPAFVARAGQAQAPIATVRISQNPTR